VLTKADLGFLSLVTNKSEDKSRGAIENNTVSINDTNLLWAKNLKQRIRV